MWYNDDFIRVRDLRRRRRPASRPRAAVLNARTMTRARRRELSRRTALWAGGLLGGLILLAGAVFGVALAGRALFSNNDRFRITSLQIEDDGSIATHFIRERRHIGEGTNLFAFSAARVREEFLRQSYAAKYKSMQVIRILPGTLVVRVAERVPLARVGTFGNLVADRDGHIFGMRAGSRALPALVGHRGTAVTPGQRMGGAAIAALQAIEACNDPDLGITVESVDLEDKDALSVYLKPGAAARGFRLAWNGMGRDTPEAHAALRRQLGRVSRTMRQKDARHSMLDATYDDRVFGAP